jgi:ribosome-binding factor A
MQETLREVAAEFLSREAGPQSLLTVTRAVLSDDGHRAVVYITAFPDSAEKAALAFANRNIPELKEFFKTRVKGVLPPHITFEFDLGEKSRQRLDELTK